MSHQKSPSGQIAISSDGVVVSCMSSPLIVVVSIFIVVVAVSLGSVVVSLDEKVIADAENPPRLCNSSISKGNNILPQTRVGITRSRKFMLFIEFRFVIVV